MSMGDDVASATMQVTMKAAEVAIDTVGKNVDRVMDNIAKLFAALGNRNGRSTNNREAGGREKPVKSTDLTDLKTGEVKMRDLIANCRQTGAGYAGSENGLTQADMKYVAKKAKEYGIPVAFTGDKGKDNLYAHVRANDVPVLNQICTEMIRDKIEVRPQELGNFKVKAWEIPFINAELKKHDLPAQFGKTRDGEYFCLCEKSDEKAVLIARGEFIRKCDEIKKETMFDRDTEGYLTIKDIRSGREINFEQPPSREELSLMLQEQFGYDENKAGICCAKFGEEMLEGDLKEKFFSKNPQNEFSKVDANIEVQGESVLTKDYNCWRLTPKEDRVPRIVFQNQDGNFAVLTPEKMTQREMVNHLRTNLNITDNQTLLALVNKAEKVSDYYATQENHTMNYEFKKLDFDMTDPLTIGGMRRTDNHGDVFVKALPISDLNCTINRNNKESFVITSKVTAIEKDEDGREYPTTDTKQLRLSFSDKKNGIQVLTNTFKEQGVPEHIAHQKAKDAFKQAEAQSAEKILLVEEVKADKATISHAGKMLEVDTTDLKTAADEISKEFDISEEAAEKVLEKAEDKANPLTLDDLVQEEMQQTFGNENEGKMSEEAVNEDTAEIGEKNGHEVHNTDVLKDLKPDAPDASAPSVPDVPAPKLPDAPKVDIPAPRGRH